MSNFASRQAVKRVRRRKDFDDALRQAAILGAKSVLDDVVQIRAWWYRCIAWLPLPSDVRKVLVQHGGVRYELRRESDGTRKTD